MRFFVSSFLLMCLALSAFAQSPAQEENGLGDGPAGPTPVRDANARALVLQRLGTTGVLLIPESTNDRVMAFDPMTGDLLDPDFIPADPANLSTPISAIGGFAPDTVLVSDQLEDVVQMYGTDGTYMGIFAPAGGPDPAILDNIRGIAMSASGTLLVTVGSGANADAIAEFDSFGNYLGNFVANASGGLDSPFDILVRSNDNLVGGITSDDIISYDMSGAFNSIWSPINTFPEQIAEAASGNVLVANFSGSEEGIVEYTSDGTLVGVYDPASLGGYRGAYELANGNILTTNGGGVHEVDRSGNLVRTIIGSVSARFIEPLGPSIVCENIIIDATLGDPIYVYGNPGCVFDLYNTGCSDDPANWTLIVEGMEIPDTGVVNTGIIAGADSCYGLAVNGETDLVATSQKTVPTLQTWGLIVFMVVLMGSALLIARRRRDA